MKHRTHSGRIMIAVLALLASLMSPISAHAGGGTPPPTSETPVQTSTPAPVEVIPTESPTPKPTHLPPTKPGIDHIPTKLEFGNPPVVSTPTPAPGPLQTTSPDSKREVANPDLTDMLQELSGETKVIVLGDNGKLLPLVSQTAAGIFAQSDPIWCPEGVAPGGAGCTSAYATLTDLLSNAGTYINSQNVNGIIWITSGNVADTSTITIDGSNYTNWSNYTLTLQGGWSGINGDTIIGSNSVFSNPITITNWNNGITIQNIDTSSINLSNVLATQGNGVSVKDVNSDVHLDNVHVYGAIGIGASILNASNVTIRNSSFIGDTGGGVYINSFTNSGAVIDNVTVDGNSGFGLAITTAGGDVMLNNSQFTNTLSGFSNPVFIWGDGVDIYNAGGSITIAQSSFTGNTYGLYAPYAGNINISQSQFTGNREVGLATYSYDGVTLNDVTASNNSYIGLSIGTSGDVTLNSVLADGDGTGVSIYSANSLNFLGGSITNNQIGLCLYYLSSTYPDLSSTNITNNEINVAVDDGCFSSPNPPTPQPQTFLQTQGELFGLDCSKVEHRYVVRLANGDRGEIYCPVNGEASIDRVDNTFLPKNLPAGYTYASAFEVKIMQRNNQPISVIKEGGYIVASFVAPRSEFERSYAILYWDEENNTWIPLKDLLLDQKGKPENFELYPGNADDKRRILSGVDLVKKNGESRIEVSTNFPGVFVLVQQ